MVPGPFLLSAKGPAWGRGKTTSLPLRGPVLVLTEAQTPSPKILNLGQVHEGGRNELAPGTVPAAGPGVWLQRLPCVGYLATPTACEGDPKVTRNLLVQNRVCVLPC